MFSEWCSDLCVCYLWTNMFHILYLILVWWCASVKQNPTKWAEAVQRPYTDGWKQSFLNTRKSIILSKPQSLWNFWCFLLGFCNYNEYSTAFYEILWKFSHSHYWRLEWNWQVVLILFLLCFTSLGTVFFEMGNRVREKLIVKESWYLEVVFSHRI